MHFYELRQDLQRFGDELKHVLQELQLYDGCRRLEMDHICVRLSSDAAVLALKSELEQFGQAISGATVNGRLIYIIELAEPLSVLDWEVYGVELPHPKPGSSYVDGWEHVEFVLACENDTMPGICSRFTEFFPGFTYETTVSEPHASADQLPNPTVAVSKDGIGIKFHARSIQEVVGHIKPR